MAEKAWLILIVMVTSCGLALAVMIPIMRERLARREVEAILRELAAITRRVHGYDDAP